VNLLFDIQFDEIRNVINNAKRPFVIRRILSQNNSHRVARHKVVLLNPVAEAGLVELTEVIA
tara:strand:+ start:29 stop:214 length:186 start_codon:yes stop_codon:yes gene_type:complete